MSALEERQADTQHNREQENGAGEPSRSLRDGQDVIDDRGPPPHPPEQVLSPSTDKTLTFNGQLRGLSNASGGDFPRCLPRSVVAVGQRKDLPCAIGFLDRLNQKNRPKRADVQSILWTLTPISAPPSSCSIWNSIGRQHT